MHGWRFVSVGGRVVVVPPFTVFQFGRAWRVSFTARNQWGLLVVQLERKLASEGRLYSYLGNSCVQSNYISVCEGRSCCPSLPSIPRFVSPLTSGIVCLPSSVFSTSCGLVVLQEGSIRSSQELNWRLYSVTLDGAAFRGLYPLSCMWHPSTWRTPVVWETFPNFCQHDATLEPPTDRDQPLSRTGFSISSRFL